MMAAGEELLHLLDGEIPNGRKSLQENYLNLENVAKYCESNYLKASRAQKAEALEETKNYTNHSLASVAYQINDLATNFLRLLDLQTSQLTDMESSVNHLNQIVMIHKEKVARREIGVLTAAKQVPKPLGMKNGVIYPAQSEQPIRYVRKEIDYTELDGVGHGFRAQGGAPRTPRSPSIHSNSGSDFTNNNQTAKLSASLGQLVGSGGTTPDKTRTSHYMTPGPQGVPPSTPKSEEAYSRLSSPRGQSMTMPTPPPPPPADYDDGGFSQPSVDLPVSPPPPPPPDYQRDQFDFQSIPPPPPDLETSLQGPPSARNSRVSVGSVPENRYSAARQSDDPYAATGPQFVSQPSWIPKNYLEKVIAIYDYDAKAADELSFMENAVIYVTRKNEDGWWEGTMDGQTGLFPYNYVEPCM